MRLNRGVTIFGDFPKRPPSVSDRKIDLRILGRRLPQVRLQVTLERTQTGPPTLSNVKKRIMRLEINFLVFYHQKNYQSQTPLLL